MVLFGLNIPLRATARESLTAGCSTSECPTWRQTRLPFYQLPHLTAPGKDQELWGCNLPGERPGESKMQCNVGTRVGSKNGRIWWKCANGVWSAWLQLRYDS